MPPLQSKIEDDKNNSNFIVCFKIELLSFLLDSGCDTYLQCTCDRDNTDEYDYVYHSFM